MEKKFIFFSVIGFLFIALSQGWAQEPCVDSVFAEVIQDTVIIYHTGAFYNCCAVIKDSLAQEDSIINIIEGETFPDGPCYCMCCFDLSLTIGGLQPGDYLFKVWSEDQSILYGEVWITIGGSELASLGEVEQSGCYSKSSTSGQKPKDEPCTDSVFAEVGKDTVMVYHTGAFYNCCAEIEDSLVQEDSILNILEFETFGPGGPCDCLCCFDLSVPIVGLAPGSYLIRVWNDDRSILYGEVWVTVGGFRKDGLFGDLTQSGCYDTLGVSDLLSSPPLPQTLSLSQNYPNPFNLETAISYQIPQDCRVILEVYNLLGQKVRTLVNGEQKANYYIAYWDGKDAEGKEISSGIYFYTLKAGSFTQTRKLVILK